MGSGHQGTFQGGRPVSRVFNIIKEHNWFVGEDKTLQFTVYQADDVTIQNISGWTTVFELSQEPNTAPLFSIAGVIVSAPNGLVDIAVPGTSTSGRTPGTFYYSFRRTNAGYGAILSHGKVILQRAAQTLP